MKMFVLLAVFLVSVDLIIFAEAKANTLTVDTTSGVVEGYEISSSVNAFLGIPYAEPPIRDLRFKPPVKIQRSSQTLKVYERSKACIQVQSMKHVDPEWIPALETTSEDCLYLNIWVPNPTPENAAVMVWIHGGAYEIGSGNTYFYDGQVLTTEGVIVVTMNYRLSLFGFLSLDPQEAPGNVGLMDQALALRWVKDNIANFGGNPRKVTIFGESAGASSVGQHLLIPSSQGLFQRAILESGSPTSLWSFSSKERAKNVAKQLVEAAGCLATTHMDMVHCIREKDAFELAKIGDTIVSMPISFNPVVDGDYFPENAIKLLEDRKFSSDVDILIGAQLEDGVYLPLLAGFIPYSKDIIVEENDFNEFVKAILNINTNSYIDFVRFVYTDWNKTQPNRDWRRPLIDFITDWGFKCGANLLADYAVNNGNKVYFYEFIHKSSASLMPSWAGASHTEELAFVFGLPLLKPDKFTSEEVLFSKKIMKYWTEFAKKGDPNSDDVTEWPLYTLNEKPILVLNLTLGLQHGMRLQHCSFMNHIIPKFS